VVSVCALRDIAPGEELCFAYVDPAMPLHRRRQRLKQNYGFHCTCPKCRADEAAEKLKSLVKSKEAEAEVEDGGAVSSAINDEGGDDPEKWMLSRPLVVATADEGEGEGEGKEDDEKEGEESVSLAEQVRVERTRLLHHAGLFVCLSACSSLCMTTLHIYIYIYILYYICHMRTTLHSVPVHTRCRSGRFARSRAPRSSAADQGPRGCQVYNIYVCMCMVYVLE